MILFFLLLNAAPCPVYTNLTQINSDYLSCVSRYSGPQRQREKLENILRHLLSTAQEGDNVTILNTGDDTAFVKKELENRKFKVEYANDTFTVLKVSWSRL